MGNRISGMTGSSSQSVIPEVEESISSAISNTAMGTNLPGIASARSSMNSLSDPAKKVSANPDLPKPRTWLGAIADFIKAVVSFPMDFINFIASLFSGGSSPAEETETQSKDEFEIVTPPSGGGDGANTLKGSVRITV